MNTTEIANHKTVYWHRELPPINAKALAEHIVEATSKRVSNTLLHRDELWDCCYEGLMANAGARISCAANGLKDITEISMNPLVLA
jgi:hypothetical protein